MSFAYIGPCLHHLQSTTNTSLSQISLLFVSHAAGSVVGSVVSIYVFRGARCSSVVAVSLGILAALLAVVPWCSDLTMLLAAFSGQGLACGIIATSKYTVFLLFNWF